MASMDKTQEKIQDWLDALQRESWNLELLISGFSIFLLIQAYSFMDDNMLIVQNHFDGSNVFGTLIIGLIGISQLATIVLTLNLLIHIFLRGFWIAVIGLRSVQPKIDFETLNYSAFFTRKLQNKVGGLDKLLVRLDNLSSVIFAFTFLVVFMLFSLLLYFVLLGVIELTTTSLSGYFSTGFLSSVFEIIQGVLIVIVLLSGLLYMIDTLTLGFFKKFKWTSRIFNPIYAFYGVITLSFIYRAIYYSLISRYSKTSIRIFLLSYLILIISFPFSRFDYYPFFPDRYPENKLANWRYDDLRPPNVAIADASIPSRLIAGNALPVFIRYEIKANEKIQELCPDFTPSKTPGLISGLHANSRSIGIRTPEVPEKAPDALLDCLSSYYALYLNDTIALDPTFLFQQHTNLQERGLFTVLDIAKLPKGYHELVIKNRLNVVPPIEEVEYAIIPFWKE